MDRKTPKERQAAKEALPGSPIEGRMPKQKSNRNVLCPPSVNNVNFLVDTPLI